MAGGCLAATNLKVGVKAMDSIKEFRGDNEFLSNFYKRSISIDFIPAFGNVLVIAPTNEHAFQACKTADLDQALLIIQSGDASTAKKLGRQVKLIDDWDSLKISFMKKIVEAKFKHIDLKIKLLMTGERELIEGNTWRDEFWGVSQKTGYGENHLGKILMEVRSEIKASEGNALQVLNTYLEGKALGFIGENILKLHKAAVEGVGLDDAAKLFI
jgi:ribA/ribD-fused uncharacterized protein